LKRGYWDSEKADGREQERATVVETKHKRERRGRRVGKVIICKVDRGQGIKERNRRKRERERAYSS
jgi:hypothetical protein